MSTKKIKIEVDNNFDATAKEAENASEKVQDLGKSVEDVGKSAPKAEKGLSGMTKGSKAFGVALKGMGIGLVVTVLGALKAAFERNQKAMDAVSTVVETVASVFNQVVGAITDAISSTSEAEGGFNNLKKTVVGLMNVAITPLKLSFYAIKEAIQVANLAYQKVFGDDKSVQDAKLAIKETEQAILDTANTAVDSVKDIYNNIGGAIDEIATTTTKAIKSIKDIDVEATNASAKRLVQARKNTAIAEANQKVLLEQYDRQAEKLRQVRDEERNTIEDRIKANNDLKTTLDKQEKAMLKQADLAIQGARLELKQNDTTANRVALINALAEKEGVLATVEGFRSEQKVNDMALDKEKIELTTTQNEAEATLFIEKKKRLNDLEKDELKKLEGSKAILEEEKKIELKRLASVVETATEGTQAKLDAEIAYITAKQDFGLQEIEINTQIQDHIQAKEKETEALRELNTAKDKQRTKELQEAKVQLASDAMGALSDLLGSFNAKDEAAAKRQFQVTKALNIAQAGTNTGLAVTKALAETTDPTPTQTFRTANAIMAGVMGLAQITKIASTKFGGTGGGSAPKVPSVGGGSQSPNFNVVGNSSINQIAQIQQQPMEAYVVESKITSSQALARNRDKNASL